MKLNPNLKLKYHLDLHNEPSLFSSQSVLFDILKYLVKHNKSNSFDSLKFSSKTLKYIFGDQLDNLESKEKIVNCIKELLKTDYLKTNNNSMYITKKTIDIFYT